MGGDSSETSSPASSSPQPLASTDTYMSGSHTYTFRAYSRTKGFGTGKYLVSNTFNAGGYEWAIAFYPEGKKEHDNGYMSLYIRLESYQTDVSALFELILVDQSGKGKHKIQTQFGKQLPCLMKHRGSQWGFSRFLRKKHLEKSGFLRNDCLVVNCKVGVVMAIPEEIAYSPPSVADQITRFMKIQGIVDSNFKETKLSLLNSAAKTILDSGSPLQLKEGLIFDGDRERIDQYLHAVDEIQQSIKSGMIIDYERGGIDVIQMAMKTLKLVFRGILDRSVNMVKTDGLNSTTYSSSETNSYSYELQEEDHLGHGELSSMQVYHLRRITERLNLAGSLGDCIEVYKISRKSVVDARLLRFDIGKWSSSDFRSLDWNESAAKIKLWTRAAHGCYRIIFPREKQNYEHIFDGVGAVTYDNCFVVIVKNVAVELNNFVEAITTTPASLQKLFDILDLYEALLVILPDIKATFHAVSSADIYLGAVKTADRLEDLVRQILSSFEDTVLHEQLNPPFPVGQVNSLTRYAMDYVIRIMHYKELMTKIIILKPKISSEILDDVQFLEFRRHGGSPLGLHFIWTIMSLKFNLEAKSRHYESTSLGNLFIMNNVHYVVEKIKGSSELLELIGEDYLTTLTEYVMQAAKTFLGFTWDRVVYCLRVEGLNQKFPFYNGISKNALKDRFKSFNSTFEQVCRAQSTCLVPDFQLRRQLHVLILEKLIPAYESFLLQFRSHIERERYPEKYIKYSTEDLKNKVHGLFLVPQLSMRGL